MAALILPSRRVVQPQGPVEIDWANPLTSALALDARGDQFFRDTAAGRIPTQSVGSFTRAATSYGFAANLASAVTSFGDVELFPVNAQAAFQIIDIPDNLTQVSGLLNKRASATSQNSFSIGYNYVGSEFNVDLGNSAGTNVSLSYRFDRSTFSTSGNNLVVILDGAGAAGQRIRAYRNGVLVSATAATDNATASLANTTSPLEIGRVNNGTLYYAGKILLVRAWSRVLDVAEVKALSENPWQLYRPIQRRIWVPLAGGVVSHDTSGALANAGGATSGAADSSTARASSGVLANPGGTAAGTAARTRALASSGVLANPGAQVVGSANHQAAAVSHATSGVLANPGANLSGTAQNGVSVIGKGFEFTDTPSALWWKRKPKALPEEVAEQQVQRVVRVIKEVAAKQQPEQTAKQAQRQVAQAVAPLLAEMPGFDWTPLYRNIVADFERQREEAARIEAVAQIARIRALEQDDEDILLLMI